jgi:hypothetical protein
MYTTLENALLSFTSQRDAIASQMISMLDGAVFNGQAINKDAAGQLVDQAAQLLSQVHELAESL